MSEFVKASAPPKCLCGKMHWRNEWEKCDLRIGAPPPAEDQSRNQTVENKAEKTKRPGKPAIPSRKKPTHPRSRNKT